MYIYLHTYTLFIKNILTRSIDSGGITVHYNKAINTWAEIKAPQESHGAGPYCKQTSVKRSMCICTAGSEDTATEVSQTNITDSKLIFANLNRCSEVFLVFENLSIT